MTDSAESPKPVLTSQHQAAVEAYAAELAKQPDLSPHTRAAYIAALRRFLAWLDDPDTVTDWSGDPLTDAAAKRWAVTDWRQAALTKKLRDRDGRLVALTPGTVKTTLAGLNDFYLRRGMDGIPVAEVKRPKSARRAPTALRGRDRVRWDRTVLELSGKEGPRNRAIAGVMRYAGLRREEATLLDLDDITLSARKGTIRVTGKGTRVRVVPANAPLREALRAWLDDRRNWNNAETESALFITRRGGRIKPRTLNDVVTAIAEAAGFHHDDPPVEITPHTLRHTFGTELVRDQKEDLFVVADLMGHEDINTTRLYAAASEDDLQAAVDRIDTRHLR